MSEQNFEHIESVYWVFTQLCNDKCDHCYNLSGPQGARISEEDCLRIVDNLPESMGRLILSGGEPLAERKKLYAILDKLKERYQGRVQVMLQTNGDLLTGEILDTLIEKGISRFDIASIDRYHKYAGAKLEELAKLFESRGVNGENEAPLVEKDTYLSAFPLSWGHWGATEDMWLGGNWARGRAMQKNIWKQDPNHNFCAILSGGIGFLTGGKDIPQEISIQLWQINPCCPGTKKPIGDAREEKVSDVLKKVAQSEVFQRINEGDPFRMGESIGVTEEYARKRTEVLQNVCLWCDEFFEKHYDIAKMEKRCNGCSSHSA
ncbi:radical SAM protein [Limibacter armeniacum]|uniref:radical SAM protein n=1 Tax=Limibacter armeniacum TaxID=466084 RepID=UPI002FE5F041